ncbi:MAG: class I SAM-dependent rRNA methyltransferase [Myxococcales bacterium]|nr:class I SAM-dependent rRNA methyltransferase [Myxococcales bacterium]
MSVQLPRRLLAHVLRGHPWIYADAIERPAGARAGDIARVTCGGKRVALALYDDDSPIALRVLTTSKQDRVGPPLWRRRVDEALALRRAAIDFERTDAFRLINGEGDGLPGVHVDHYAGYLALKLDTPAWRPHLAELVEALASTPGLALRGIWFKGHHKRDAAAAAAAPPGALWGAEPPDPVEVREHGMRLIASLQRGQKTGLFLDQRENRALIRRVSAGRDVLNLFSYNGGFSIAAALGGARRVTSVDSAGAAMDDARRIFALNGLDPNAHEFATADVFAFLEGADARGARYDLIVCDPPSFAPRKQAVPKASSAYARLHAAALRHVRPGGLYAGSSCSSHITVEMFLETMREGAARARRVLRLLELREAPLDHPSPLAFPEGRYLKFALTRVD